MTITINGSGTIAGLSAGGLPDATVTQADLASGVAGTGPAFRVYKSANQTLTAGVNTKIALDVEDIDTASCFDTSTNRFTPNVAGYYQFNALVGLSAASVLDYNYIQIRKNAALTNFAIYAPYLGKTSYGSLSILIYMNGTTDYVELYVQATGSGTITVEGAACSFSGFLARAA